MNTKIVIILLAAAIMLPSTVLPNAAFAAETVLSVKKNDATCSPTATGLCFGTIQDAINYVNEISSNGTDTTTTFSIQVEAGEYNEAVILGSRITSLKGRETAKTILTGSGSGTLVTASTSSINNISNLTFANAAIGIDASNYTSSFAIKNNIFRNVTTAVLLQNSTNTNITNNIFFANGTAIRTDADKIITNNIFLSNTTAIDSTAPTLANITYNDFNSNTADGPWTNISTIDISNIVDLPLFVDTGAYDFHLKTGSPCIGTGQGSVDRGAYGGSGTDTIPFQVSGVTVEQASETSAVVNWNKSLDYKVTGYRVWYGKTAGGPYNGTEAGQSPISVPTGTFESTYTLNGLTATVSTPESPVLYAPTPLNESLSLSWSPVAGATKYKVYWSDSSFDLSSLPSTSVDVGNTTAFILPGLINGANYQVAVTAIAEAAYYITVTSIYSAVSPSPGSNESIYSEEKSVGTGEIKESALSNIQIDFPEALTAYPNLPDSGKNCFIATAAYGHYSTPQVQALRTFRDRYLLTNGPGSAFVRWYYKHGPVAAAYLDAHPLYKPVVRAALLPAVGTALFMTSTSLFIKAVVSFFFLVLVLMTVYRFSRKRLSGSGGGPMKNIILLLLVLVLPSAAYAEDPGLDQPHWSLELKGGTFAPAIERWADFYGKKNMPVYTGTLAYKVLRQLEIGVGAGMARDKGLASAPLHNSTSGSVIYKLFPLNVFVLARGLFSEDQWVVPYIGGGWTRMYYREKIAEQDEVRGSADGYHVRGGIQLLLNKIDQSAAHSMYLGYGVHHTYFFVEAERTKAKLKTPSVDLGGTAYMMGLLFEF